MTQHFPIVIEHEANGTWSAWVAGLPGVYAAADSLARAKRAIREAVTAHLDTLGDVGQLPRGKADVVVLLAAGAALALAGTLAWSGGDAAPARPEVRRFLITEAIGVDIDELTNAVISPDGQSIALTGSVGAAGWSSFIRCVTVRRGRFQG